MNLESLIRRFRVMTQDKAEPYLWEDEDVTDWLNEAEEQAAIRGRLIREDANDDVCRIDLTPGTHTYPLHESILEIINLRMLNASDAPEDDTRVYIQSREWLDSNEPTWRNRTERAIYAIQDDKTIRLVGNIPEDSWLQIECYRLPLEPLVGDYDCPEIHRAHHEHLIDWALHKAYEVPDTEVFDPDKSQRAEREFTKYFGPEPDSDLRRMTREDLDQHNLAIMP